jgi:hypothetical protein
MHLQKYTKPIHLLRLLKLTATIVTCRLYTILLFSNHVWASYANIVEVIGSSKH